MPQQMTPLDHLERLFKALPDQEVVEPTEELGEQDTQIGVCEDMRLRRFFSYLVALNMEIEEKVRLGNEELDGVKDHMRWDERCQAIQAEVTDLRLGEIQIRSLYDCELSIKMGKPGVRGLSMKKGWVVTMDAEDIPEIHIIHIPPGLDGDEMMESVLRRMGSGGCGDKSHGQPGHRCSY